MNKPSLQWSIGVLGQPWQLVLLGLWSGYPCRLWIECSILLLSALLLLGYGQPGTPDRAIPHSHCQRIHCHRLVSKIRCLVSPWIVQVSNRGWNQILLGRETNMLAGGLAFWQSWNIPSSCNPSRSLPGWLLLPGNASTLLVHGW